MLETLIFGLVFGYIIGANPVMVKEATDVVVTSSKELFMGIEEIRKDDK